MRSKVKVQCVTIVFATESIRRRMWLIRWLYVVEYMCCCVASFRRVQRRSSGQC
jgi:hypothetical protein